MRIVVRHCSNLGRKASLSRILYGARLADQAVRSKIGIVWKLLKGLAGTTGLESADEDSEES